jgi:HEAT repeat protein
VPQLRPALYALLRGERVFGTPAAAMDHLARHPDEALVPMLAEALDDRTGAVRDRAARILRDRPEPQLVPILLDKLAAAGATGPIIEVLLAWHAPELVPVLTARIEASRRPHPQWAEALGRVGTVDCVPGLLAIARAGNSYTSASALRGLGAIAGFDVTDYALDFCDHPDPGVRAEAVRLLADRGQGTTASRRLAALSDGPHQSIAVRGLARLADPETTPALAQVVVSAPDRATRHLAGRTLRAMNREPYLRLTDPRVRRVAVWLTTNAKDAVRYLTDADGLVRARAAARLGEVGSGADSVEPLRAALGDPSPRVRANAATALGRLRPSNLAEVLKPALADPHRDVRNAATAALRP